MDLLEMQQYISDKGVSEEEYLSVTDEVKGFTKELLQEYGREAIVLAGTDGIIEFGKMVGKSVPQLPPDFSISDESLYRAVITCIGMEMSGDTEELPDFPFTYYVISIITVYVLFVRIKVRAQIDNMAK
jgi:hypothetical protein